ncbi:MAG: FAD-dependent oxidoreductase [Planctomycetaceae bacterium]|jgi:NADPH-dependent 2,4-dienoyl-CoA reductase/sulfur reductase-like enzyme/rhodanese-related sulfurtransferase|nr:FAD-dependent oxidoreductase [Planctomycetaceae bacterium]
MTCVKKTLIVGGSAGGATAAARLRRLSENMEIILLERGEFISFANCGLPYFIGGEIAESSKLTLQTPKAFHARYNVDIRVRHEAAAIDVAAKTATVKNHQTGETYTETYDALILSPGAEPIRPDGFDSEKIFTLRNIPDAFRIKKFLETQNPKTALVVGGGSIGLEMAENLHRAGLQVTILEQSDHLLAPLDNDIACDVHRHIESKGVRLLLNTKIQAVAENAGQIRATLKNGEISADMMILSIGVTPESSPAKAAGLAVGECGGILVNERMQTSDANIYAVGDAAETLDFATGRQMYIPLAGPANKQARIAADNICGYDSRYAGAQRSAIVRIFDKTAAAGLNETVAKNAGWNYEKMFLWLPSHAEYYPGAANMSIKIVFEKTTGKILGAQIVGGEGVDKRCDVLALALRAGMTAYDLTQLEFCYAPPYSSAKDPVNMAGFAIENVLTGKVKLFHWHDVESLRQTAKQPDAKILLLDVRTRREYENGHIGGFVNIPLDELRERLNELDRDKKIYTTCQVGRRGYLACRILSQNGFDVYNLSGGYRLYHLIFRAKEKQNVASLENIQSAQEQGVEIVKKL